MESVYEIPRISHTARQVAAEFRRVLRETKESMNWQTSYENTKVVEIEDVSEKYHLWAGNLGALHGPEDSRSLDYRFRDALHVQDRTIELLEELLDLLRNAPFLDPERSVVPPTDPTLGVPCLEQELVHEILDLKPSEECQENCWSASISYLITRLFRVSKLVAKSTMTDRHARAEAVRSDQFDSRYDIAHIGHKFERLQTKPWLLNRLGETNTKRRNYFRYCRLHRAKLAAEPATEPDSTKPSLRETDITKSARLSDHKTCAKTTHSRPSNIDTVASTMGFVDLQTTEDGFDDTCTISTMANSISESEGSDTLSVPKLNAIAEPGVDFECPYCFTMQRFNGQRGWQKHLFNDLRPYQCTSDDCGVLMFANRRTWEDHEMQIHRRTWRCELCQRQHFGSRTEAESHLKAEHKDIAKSQQCELLLETCSRPIEIFSAKDCDFCDWAAKLRKLEDNSSIAGDHDITVTASQYLKHVAGHLEQVALFSLPRNLFSEADSAVAGIGTDGSSTSKQALPDLSNSESVRDVSTQGEVNTSNLRAGLSVEQLFDFTATQVNGDFKTLELTQSWLQKAETVEIPAVSAGDSSGEDPVSAPETISVPESTRQPKNSKRQPVTKDQLMTLEIEFNKNWKPTKLARKRIASDISMTERSVQLWFQNRRAKLKKLSKQRPNGGDQYDGVPESMRQYLAMQNSMPGREVTTNTVVIQHFACRSLSIGTWRRVAQTTMDLVIFYSPDKAVLTYYINNDSAGYKIEYPFAWIRRITLEQGDVLSAAEGASPRAGRLVIELTRPPKFYMDGSGSGGFYKCHDFTEDEQASSVLIHQLGGPSKVLSGQLAKLVSLEAYQRRHDAYGHSVPTSTSSNIPANANAEPAFNVDSQASLSDFFVHEDFSIERDGRSLSSKNQTSNIDDSAPKNYVFANTGPEHFELARSSVGDKDVLNSAVIWDEELAEDRSRPEQESQTAFTHPQHNVAHIPTENEALTGYLIDSGSDVSRSASPTAIEMTEWGFRNDDGTWICAYPGCMSKSRFSRGCDLRKHYNRHTKSFVCRYDGCTQGPEGGFGSKKDRARHEAKHNPNILCEWDGCDRLFSRVDNMKDHVRRVHKQKSDAVTTGLDRLDSNLQFWTEDFAASTPAMERQTAVEDNTHEYERDGDTESPLEATELEQRMLLMDDRRRPARTGIGTSKTQLSAADVNFSRFRTLEVVRQKQEEADRIKKRTEARAILEKQQAEERASSRQNHRLMAQRQREIMGSVAQERQTQSNQPHPAQVRAEQLRAMQLRQAQQQQEQTRLSYPAHAKVNPPEFYRTSQPGYSSTLTEDGNDNVDGTIDFLGTSQSRLEETNAYPTPERLAADLSSLFEAAGASGHARWQNGGSHEQDVLFADDYGANDENKYTDEAVSKILEELF